MALPRTFSLRHQLRSLTISKNINFWDITPYNPLSVNRRFGGTYRLHRQGRRNNFSKKPAIKEVLFVVLPFFVPRIAKSHL
jgi:hypothetical protein